ncbi:MAG: hypothetical protein K6C94_06530 [Candidatus Gastranaerophilales bacterium]|nr:hypothetical protein [Candidatus Gastranaerophilales bacterium]
MSINFVSFNPDAVYNGLQLSARQMPLNPLGNKEVERATVEDSEDLRRTQGLLNLGGKVYETQRTDVNKEPEGNVPWNEIMEQLQLECTGNEEEDFNNILDEINFQINNAQTQYDMNYYKWLLDYTYRVFMSVEDARQEYMEETQPDFYSIYDYNSPTFNMQML